MSDSKHSDQSRDAMPQDDLPLSEVHNVWEQQARSDPLWAVLSDPAKRQRNWDLAAFMATGEEYVRATLGRFAELGGTFVDRDVAVDFGSGVGRLSQPLADHFSLVLGVDIAETMVDVARRLNRQGERVNYVRNERSDLSFLDESSVSFVHTFITLQHMPPSAARSYLREFFRVAKPGAGVVFQLPSHLSEHYLPSDRDDQPLTEQVAVAEIELVGPELAEVGAGTVFAMTVAVTNRGAGTWKQSHVFPLHVGDRWIDAATGELRIPDDQRVRLPGAVRPGETATIELMVRAPQEPGRYRLRIDVVQEGVRWFADALSVPFEAPVNVASIHDSAQPGSSSPSIMDAPTIFEDLIDPQYSEPAAFEMHGIARADVEELIRDVGGVLLGADEHVDEWYSYTYFVQIPS